MMRKLNQGGGRTGVYGVFLILKLILNMIVGADKMTFESKHEEGARPR